MVDIRHPQPQKGRGSVSNQTGRFEPLKRLDIDDGWELEDESPRLRTTITNEACRSAITTNQSPDLPFEQSINPYRGCEHGCSYCYARPSHAHMGLSPGLDFESRLFAKPDIARVLEKELRKPGYVCKPIMLGTNTDPYQPIERDLRLTREILQVLSSFNHPLAIVTKSDLVLRDLDILAPMAEQGLASVAISVTTLDRELARKLEPRAPVPRKRLQAIESLSAAGIPVSTFAAPVIPFINDGEMESIIEAGARCGAVKASYILLKLPLEMKELFADWLRTHTPGKEKHVLSLVRQSRNGKLNQSDFRTRMTGTGEWAELLARRFKLQCKKSCVQQAHRSALGLDTSLFSPPPRAGDQLALF